MDRVITIKTDATTKKEAQALAKELGLTLSDLINDYLKQAVASRQANLHALGSTTPKLEQAIRQADKNRRSGRISRGYKRLDDFLKALKS